MKKFLYEWIKYSVIFGAISFTYIIIFVFIIGIDLYRDDLDVYRRPEDFINYGGVQSAQTLSTVGFIFHEITSLFRFYFMDIFTIFFARRSIYSPSYPLSFISDYLFNYKDYYWTIPIISIISVVINSFIFGIIIYGVNKVSGIIEYTKKYFINRQIKA
jgi:hypothetical protein